MFSRKRILIIGGTGAVGSMIARELLRFFPDSDIVVSARNIPTSIPSGLQGRTLDAFDENALLQAVVGMDLVVIAAGPFSYLGTKIHAACIKSGVDIVDINDNEMVTRGILSLEEESRKAGVHILTGMGFTPGLSTLLLVRLAQKNSCLPNDYRISIYMGARNTGGPSNSSVLLEGFKARLPFLNNGKTVLDNAVWTGSNAKQFFPGYDHPVSTVPFASPEFHTLAAYQLARNLGILSLRSRYHVQYLSSGFACLLAKSRILRLATLRQWMCGIFYRFGRMLSYKPDADETTSLVVFSKGETSHLGVHGPVSTGHLTASVAVAAVTWLLKRQSDVAPGVWPMERILVEYPDASSHIETYLRQRGVIISDDCFPTCANDYRSIFGHSATFDGSAASLRHIGQCWYDIETIPPRIVRMQRQILRHSDLWKRVVDSTSFVQRLLLTVRMKRLHWSLFSLARRTSFGLRGSPAINQRILKDFSLFAAGCLIAKECLGDDAYNLYADMFLESSRMEMAWLWPSNQVFSFSERPFDVLLEYLQAYFGACARLNVVNLEMRVHPDGLDITFKSCTYGAILTTLGCAPLRGLVRQMELEAIQNLADRCGVYYRWHSGRVPDEGRLVLCRMEPPASLDIEPNQQKEAST